MPEISRFFGIVIRMFVEVGGRHHRPHFHAYYQGHTAIIAIDTAEVIAGRLPTRQRRLALAWAEIHLMELQTNWDRLQQGSAPTTIDPLR